MKFLGERFERKDPAPAYPGAQIIWTSNNPERDQDTAERLIEAGKTNRPTYVPDRSGLWLVTAVEVRGDTIEARGVSVDPKRETPPDGFP